MSRLLTIPRTFALALIAFVLATPVHAQNMTPDVRWQPWLGCWQATDATIQRAVGSSNSSRVLIRDRAGCAGEGGHAARARSPAGVPEASARGFQTHAAGPATLQIGVAWRVVASERRRARVSAVSGCHRPLGLGLI